MGKLFWFVLAGLIAVAVHIAYVLFVPAMQHQSYIASLTGNESKPSVWRIISDTERFNMLPGYSGSGIAAACPIDLKLGKMELSLSVPKNYWVLSIYSQSGKQVYSLNDKQAGAEAFSVIVSRAKSLKEQIFGTGDPDEAAGVITNAAWNVELPDQRGLAVLWIPSSSDALQPALARLISKSACKQTAGSQ